MDHVDVDNGIAGLRLQIFPVWPLGHRLCDVDVQRGQDVGRPRFVNVRLNTATQ